MPLALFSLLAAAAAAAALLTAAYSQTITTFSNCDRTFSCGAIQNISYPFIGGARPSYCGVPDLALSCRSNNVTVLTHNKINYRVLLLDQEQKRLVLSRADLYHTTCPSRFRNSTLKSTLLSSNASQNQDLTLFYGCNSTATSTTRRCRTISSIAALAVSISATRITCVPEERSCSQCYKLGGQCGYDSVLSQLVCACGDRPCHIALTLPPVASPSPQGNGSNSDTGRNIGLFIGGAVLAGVGLGWLIFYYRQKRKQRLQRLATGSIQTASKDALTPPSSKDLSTPPSTKFVKSIPSYPSSKSDFGRDSTYFGVQVFTYPELEEATNNFDPSKELGDGGFGTVYYGVLADGRVVAVKRLYENNFKRVEQFMNELEILTQAVDTNRHRHDINLANMAVNKIQNHTLHELVDSSIGFETNTTVRRMATLVAELAFRCLQQVKDMRPSMEEVVEALKSIKNEDFNAHKVEIVDILVDDETGPLKSSVAPPSPDSVAASGSTPNSSA
ncbi:hypothetical protein SASPL_146830 [Salvia splendens]|uniref:Protein kinase domain-containing protein n=1 Tax=Salvia splendens TaxID=180675 RepID=A0A8X8Z5K4_SALSN|nr:hypothetical protein SASPL_146830 [Salvia splendens]